MLRSLVGSEMCIRDRHRGRPRRYQVNPWSRRREVARGVQRSSLKPEKRPIFCHRRGIENFVACFLHSSVHMCLYQTPGWRPPPITGCFVNTVTRGWVGAPNGLAPFRFVFFGVFEKFDTFFFKICAHSERYRNLLPGSFEILTFDGNIAFPLSPV